MVPMHAQERKEALPEPERGCVRSTSRSTPALPGPLRLGNPRVTSQHLTIELPLGGALLRFCSASNVPRTVSPPSRRSHIPSSQPTPPVRSISTRTPSAPNTAPNPELDLHTVHERPPTSPSSLFLPLQSPMQKPGAPRRGAWPPAAPAHLRAHTVSGSGQTSCRRCPLRPCRRLNQTL